MGGGKKPRWDAGVSSSGKARREMQDSEVEVEEVEGNLSGGGEERGQVGERSRPVEEWLIRVPSEDSARTTETVRRHVCSGASLNEPRVPGSKWLNEVVKRRMGMAGMTTVPQDGAGPTSAWIKRLLGFKSMATLEGTKTSLYYGKPPLGPEPLDVQVEMRWMLNRVNWETFSGLTRLLSPSSVYNPDGSHRDRPRRNRDSRHFDGFSGRHHVEGTEYPSDSDPEEASEYPAEADPHNTEVEEENGMEEVEDDGKGQPEDNDSSRPGDDIIPHTASDYQPIPNFIPRFDPNEETTIGAIRDLRRHTFPRFKRRCESLFGFASLRNHHAVSSRQSRVNNRAHRRRWASILQPPTYETSDIIKRKEGLTGRRLMVGSTEIRILPKISRKKLLYYLMDVGDGLLLTVNDLGKWYANAYPEYKDDLLIMHWLIDTRVCRKWSFTVDNLCCPECVSSWRIKRESSKIKVNARKQARCARIICPHSTKVKKFFLALGAMHTSRMRRIKLLVSAENCLNPETISSAVHTLTTTFPTLEKVEVEYQPAVDLLPERMLRRRRRWSIVRSLRHLEKWIPAGERLRVSGLDNHPRLVSAWNEAKRGWYYDADRTVRFLWGLRRSQTRPGLGRRASSL